MYITQSGHIYPSTLSYPIATFSYCPSYRPLSLVCMSFVLFLFSFCDPLNLTRATCISMDMELSTGEYETHLDYATEDNDSPSPGIHLQPHKGVGTPEPLPHPELNAAPESWAVPVQVLSYSYIFFFLPSLS